MPATRPVDTGVSVIMDSPEMDSRAQVNYHRLNGSSSTVLTATSFLWGSQKFDPHRIRTPDLIEIKFGTVHYVSDGTPLCEISCKSLPGGLLGKWVK